MPLPEPRRRPPDGGDIAFALQAPSSQYMILRHDAALIGSQPFSGNCNVYLWVS